MKLAEALILRADLDTRMEELRARLTANALVQEGEQPAEDPAELLSELEQTAEELCRLIYSINLTNASVFKDGRSITELLARREVLSRRISVMQSFLDTASRQVMRGSRMEVKVHSTVPVPELRKKTDELSRELRKLDTSIQALNWQTELK